MDNSNLGTRESLQSLVNKLSVEIGFNDCPDMLQELVIPIIRTCREDGPEDHPMRINVFAELLEAHKIVRSYDKYPADLETLIYSYLDEEIADEEMESVMEDKIFRKRWKSAYVWHNHNELQELVLSLNRELDRNSPNFDQLDSKIEDMKDLISYPNEDYVFPPQVVMQLKVPSTLIRTWYFAWEKKNHFFCDNIFIDLENLMPLYEDEIETDESGYWNPTATPLTEIWCKWEEIQMIKEGLLVREGL